MESKSKKSAVNDMVEEFQDTCGEYLFCLMFASNGIETNGDLVAKEKAKPGQKIWIASDTKSDPKYHARMDVSMFVEKSKKNGFFVNELCKSLLCSIYSLWDETYRHKIAKAAEVEAGALIAPLMGDLRKIRHCIIHNKSIIPEDGYQFEVLTWKLAPGALAITAEMFREFIDIVRTKMAIQAASLTPEMLEIYQLMTKKEKESFDSWFKKPGNKQNDIPWPGMNDVLKRINKIEK
ncbi:hypothetical protein [Pseudomonas urmiensis]|uniref:Uncharacterized protein n=1 Tax=Pseudomonas urmiensis TaxID=2745493 RepID=A0A923JYE5_9PSED|nr:hypothetical protein [Pseudomonas urmiensis]MBV4537240.1 hypothetical protein [Pseudomonas urmiensis]